MEKYWLNFRKIYKKLCTLNDLSIHPSIRQSILLDLSNSGSLERIPAIIGRETEHPEHAAST